MYLIKNPHQGGYLDVLKGEGAVVVAAAKDTPTRYESEKDARRAAKRLKLEGAEVVLAEDAE